MMIRTLKNNKLRVCINTLGAEITSLQDDEDEEYIWQADEKYWCRHAPILFPIVGRLKNDQYKFNNQIYHMKQHGFARDSEFEVIKASDTDIDLRLISNQTTKEKYPFDFSLTVHYELNDDQLITKMLVQNLDQKVMPFSIGAHPAFNVPLIPNNNESFSDYKVKISNPATYEGVLFEAPYADFSHTEKVDLSQPITMKYNLFYDDAKVIKLNDSKVKSTLYNAKTKRGVAVTAYNAEYAGLWSAKNAPFVCLEPWWGITDSINSNGNLEDKVGIHKLNPQDTFTAHYDIRPF
jgi:galactose mutarotase-like enzyme